MRGRLKLTSAYLEKSRQRAVHSAGLNSCDIERRIGEFYTADLFLVLPHVGRCIVQNVETAFCTR